VTLEFEKLTCRDRNVRQAVEVSIVPKAFQKLTGTDFSSILVKQIVTGITNDTIFERTSVLELCMSVERSRKSKET
jgi:hypothetical protein